MHQPERIIRYGIHGAPRSGTSWLGQLVNSAPQVCYKFQPLFSYELKDYLNAQSSKQDIEKFFELLRTTSSPFLDQTDQIEKGILPHFEKGPITHVGYKEVRYHHLLEHLLATDPDLLVVGIVRNPLAVLASWFNSAREFRRDLGWLESEEWRLAPKKNANRPEEFFGYEKWKEVALLFERLQQRYPDRFFLVIYAHLLKQPREITENVFRFLRLPFSDQTAAFIDHSRKSNVEDAYAVFKSKKDDNHWQKVLPATLVSAVQSDLEASTLHKYLMG